MKRGLLLLLSVACSILAALVQHSMAQVQIDKRKPVAANTVVSIESNYGTIQVTGWDKNEVWVRGTLAPGARELEFDTTVEDDEDENEKPVKRHWAVIQVDTPDASTFESDDDSDYRSKLEINVPKSSPLMIKTVNAAITVVGVASEQEIGSINGPIKVQGGAGEFQAESLTGSIEYEGQASSAAIETVSGAIKIGAISGQARLESVAGNITVGARRLRELAIQTTSGNITVSGSLANPGQWRIESFSGNVTLEFPEGAMGQFSARTASGEITSNVGTKPRRTERFHPFKVLEFQIGSNESEVEVETYSGAITIRSGAKP
jgi:hypothetical protein